MPLFRPAEPRLSFLKEIDTHLSEPTVLHCCGGFAMTQCYGRDRATLDVDYIAVISNDFSAQLNEFAGQGPPLHKSSGLFVHDVNVLSAYPEDYESRLSAIFPTAFERLRLFVLEAHDLALTKVERNAPRDREDVRFLADTGQIQSQVLKNCYEAEMRPYLSGRKLEQIDHNLNLWLEDFWPSEDTVP